MNNSKVAVTVCKTVSFAQMLVGIVIIFMFGICTIMYFCGNESVTEEGVSFLIFCLVFDALGIYMIFSSRKKRKLLIEFKKYVAALSTNNSGYISDLSSTLGLSQDVVVRNLEIMIEKKFFSNAYIDKNSNRIVISNNQNVQETQNGFNSDANDPFASPQIEMITVKCKACGGINTVAAGKSSRCDYCGSPIKG